MSLKSYLFLSLSACSLCANAYVVARFDLGTTASAVATGWQPVAVGVNSDNLTFVSGTQAGTTVTVFANTVLDSRDRGTGGAILDNETVNPGGSLSPVFRDFLFDNGNTQGESMTVEFTGLLANTEYNITSIHFEITGSGQIVTNWYENSIAPENLLGTCDFIDGAVVSEANFVTLNATSDGTGKITLVAEAATGPLRLNGFVVDRVTAASDLSYRIDLDNSGSAGGATGPFTEPGWTSLTLVNASTSGSVDIGGVNFAVSGFAGSRNRLANNSTTLTRDFVFSGGTEIIMAFGAAGDLPAGVWEVSMWSWDQDVAASIPPATVGYRVNGGADVVAGTGLSIDSADPVATFQFTSDGVSSYEVFIRSDSLTGGARLNAVSLSLLPPPAATLTGFTYNPADGSAEVSIQGSANTNYKLVEADDLDFANPDQDPIPLTSATVGDLTGNEVTTDGSGNATVQFNLGTSKNATFLRAETAP